MYLGSWKINDYLVFTCNTHTPSTGGVTDADVPPEYTIYENEISTAIDTGYTAKLDDAGTTGFYSEQIQLLAATGYEKGKTYTIRLSAMVGGITGTTSHTFQIEAEVDANIVSDKSGYDLSVAPPTAVQVREEMDSNSVDLNSILGDTNELQLNQGNWITSDLTVADIKAGISDGTYDLEEMMRLIFATLCGKVSGGGSSTITNRDGPDTKDRVIATVDVNGNRTAVILDGT